MAQKLIKPIVNNRIVSANLSTPVVPLSCARCGNQSFGVAAVPKNGEQARCYGVECLRCSAKIKVDDTGHFEGTGKFHPPAKRSN